MEGILKGIEMPVGETVLQCCKPNLMGNSSQSLEDQNASKKTDLVPEKWDYCCKAA